MKSKKIAAVGLGLGLLAGGGAGLALTLPGGAGAATTTVAVSGQDDPTAPPAEGSDNRPEPGARMKEQLDALVADGTITQAQADAIVAAFEANRPERPAGDADGPRGPMGERGRGPHGPMAGNLDTVAGVIGITADELRTELQSGKTLAEIATANGVDPQDVIDALVADATVRITDMVNNGRPERPAPPAGGTGN